MTLIANKPPEKATHDFIAYTTSWACEQMTPVTYISASHFAGRGAG